MSKNPLVSVIIPVYDVEKFLPDCLDSIINQTYRNLEVICVNDGSPDDSESIIDIYSAKDSRVKKINKKNRGLNAARQSGVELATGEYIMFVDSDDMIAKDCVKHLLERLTDTGADVSVGGYQAISTGGNVSSLQNDAEEEVSVGRDEAIKWLLTGWLNDSINGNNKVLRMTAWAKLYRAKLVHSTDWNLSNYRANEDELEIVQWYGMANEGVAVSTRPIYFYRTNPESITRKKYFNLNPEGKEITRFEYANEWREKVGKYVSDARFTDDINQRFVWMMQNAAVQAVEEDTFDNNTRSDMLRVVSAYQNSLNEENVAREAMLHELQSSRSWRWTRPLRVVADWRVLRFFLRIITKTIRAIVNPQAVFIRVRNTMLDIRARKKYKHAWVISDRLEEAADNGILFYDYLAEHHPKINAYYILSRTSPHYEKLKRRGVKVIDHGSEDHKRLMTYADVEASAFFNFAPFDLVSLRRKNPLVRVFIRHGIEQSDLSQHYSRMDLDLYCDVLNVSRDFYMSGESVVDISGKNIQVTGMPRYDLLRKMLGDKSENIVRNKIVFAPTWRRFLLYKPGTVERQPIEYLKDSEYYQNYTKIFNSPTLKKLGKKYEIILIPHPEMLSRIEEFNIPEHIKIKTYTDLGTRGLYNLALKTTLFVSDFSSTIFDFTLLGANVAHFNFDEDRYYSFEQEIYKSWFDIDGDGFGPSFKKPDDLIKYIASEAWTRREDNIDKVWRQIPENSSELIYQNIQKILEENER